MAITKTITCDHCGELPPQNGMGVFSMSGIVTEASIRITEPLTDPDPIELHYCSPGCLIKALDTRISSMWESRRQTVESIQRFTGNAAGKKGV